MWKIIKIILLIPVVLIVLGIAWFFVRESSHSFATNIAYLHCTLKDAKRIDEPSKTTELLELLGTVSADGSYARLRKDWIKNKVLLDFVQDEKENGLSDAYVLNIFTTNYSGTSWSDGVDKIRTIDRETLVFNFTVKDKYRIDRQCEQISEKQFEDKRKVSAAVTKAKQKI